MKPSEKEMQDLVLLIDGIAGGLTGTQCDSIRRAIDTRTAEALSEHKRVLELAEKALKRIDGENREPFHKSGTVARESLAEIAKLRKE